jgi:hypothetical protein
MVRLGGSLRSSPTPASPLYGALLVKRKFRQALIYPFAQSLCWGALHSILGVEAPLLGRAERSIPLAREGRALGARD